MQGTVFLTLPGSKTVLADVRRASADMIKNKTSVILLCASLGMMLCLLAAMGWLLSVSSFGMLETSDSTHLVPDPTWVSVAERYATFLGNAVRDTWLFLPLLVVGIIAWLKWKRDRLYSVAVIVLGCNLILVYHVAFVVLNSSIKK
jgi:hypothetical protein